MYIFNPKVEEASSALRRFNYVYLRIAEGGSCYNYLRTAIKSGTHIRQIA